MVPTVMEVGVTPGALPDVAAPATPTGRTTLSVTVATAPVSTAPTTERHFRLSLIAPPNRRATVRRTRRALNRLSQVTPPDWAVAPMRGRPRRLGSFCWHPSLPDWH